VVDATMVGPDWLRKRLEAASPDLLREMVATFIAALMGAEADAACGAGYGESSPQRVDCRNGYRHPRLRYPGRHAGRRHPQAALGQLLPGLADGPAT